MRRLSADQTRWLSAYWSKKGSCCPAKSSPTWTERCARIAPLATSTNTRRRASPGATAAGRPSGARVTAARARTIPAASATLSSPGVATWRAAMVSPVRRPVEGHDRSIEDRPDVARRGVQEPERSDRQVDRAALLGRRDEGELRARRPEIDGGTAEDVQRVRIGPVAALDDDRERGALARSDVRPEPAVTGDAGSAEVARLDGRRFDRHAVRPGLAEERAGVGTAAVDEQPVGIGPRPVHRRAGPDRARGGAPVGRHETEREAVGLRGQERQAPAVRGPVEVERRMVRARVDRRRRPGRGTVRSDREDIDPGTVRLPEGRDMAPVRRPGRVGVGDPGLAERMDRPTGLVREWSGGRRRRRWPGGPRRPRPSERRPAVAGRGLHRRRPGRGRDRR